MMLSAIFGIVVGVGMVGHWVASYINKQIPELQSEPIRIRFHLAGELATAAALILGSVGLLLAASWGPALYLVAMGMLFYTAIVSPGYFAQRGNWIWVLVFGVLVVLGILSTLDIVGSLSG